MLVVFFFQAEDGIRDRTVTGVQTCALPIYRHYGRSDCARPRYRSSTRSITLGAHQGENLRRASGLHREGCERGDLVPRIDRKSTRLNSSHRTISYAVFCLKKKKINKCESAL